MAHEAPHSLDQEHAAPVDVGQAFAEVAARERRMRAITEKLYLQGAEGRALNQAETPSVEEIQRTLDDQTILVEYYNDGAQLWAFTLDGASLGVHRLQVTADELQPLLAQLQVNLAAALKVGPQAPAISSLTRLARGLLQRLNASLVEPLAFSLRGRKRLVVVPYGALHYLPFHLLYDGSGYLIERSEVVVLPAAGLATQPGPHRRPGSLALAHSWDGRLPFTRKEAEIVQRLFGGELRADLSADRAVFKEAPVQILHIAAHGQYRLDQPDLSYIQLADGQLYADDLLQQDLSYELVTLSACETGRANVSGGDELIGLGRGFLYAGAGALVLSLWPVPDTTTVRLMERMYLSLRGGASKAAALREAQRTILAEDSQLHPAFWGAFQLVGNAAPLTPKAHAKL
jgi:CHAT domain-containing protein